VTIDLRLGRWQDVLADVECDALICDPPYGSRTHSGHDAGVDHSSSGDPRWDTARRRDLNYGHWTPDDVREFVQAWHPRTRGWFCAMSCSDLAPVWRAELAAVGRTTFQPVACVIKAMSVRLSGDGPSSWVVYLNVARPKALSKWGTLDGAYYDKEYVFPPAYVVGRGTIGHIGGKPLDLMNAIVRDYAKRGDVVCDPVAGYASTLVAATGNGCSAIGAEVDPETYASAMQRIGKGIQIDMFGGGVASP